MAKQLELIPKPKRKHNTLGRILRERLGFDQTIYDRETKHYRPQCSQCQALVINNTACHEQGCPKNHR